MLTFVAVALVCLIALLAIPVEVVFNIQRQERLQSSVSIGWLFGVVRAPVPLDGSRTTPDRPKKKKKKSRARRGNGRRAMAVIGNARFRRRLIRLFNDFLGAITVTGLKLRARLGLDDPADTGILWGIVGPLTAIAANIRSADVSIEPEFTHETLKFDSSGKIRIIPVQLIFITVMFIMSPVTIRMIWVLR